MEKVHRYTKRTISKQFWELTLVESDDKITLTKIHLASCGVKIIKESEKTITQKQAEKFKLDNKEFHIETYERNPHQN